MINPYDELVIAQGYRELFRKYAKKNAHRGISIDEFEKIAKQLDGPYLTTKRHTLRARLSELVREKFLMRISRGLYIYAAS